MIHIVGLLFLHWMFRQCPIMNTLDSYRPLDRPLVIPMYVPKQNTNSTNITIKTEEEYHYHRIVLPDIGEVPWFE